MTTNNDPQRQPSQAQEIPFVKRTSFIFSLAAVTAITATSIDIALPSHPAIGLEFGTTGEAAGLIVSTYFLGYGPGQMLWGPLADKYGRMKPLYWGIIGFILISILCALATSLESLAFYRFFQGIFGGCGPVIARAIARDQGGGKETANLMATIMMIFGAAPLLAPIIGSGILMVAEWRFIFWFLVAFGLTLLLSSALFIAPAAKDQSLTPPKRTPFSLSLLRRISSDRDFLVGATVMAVIFFGYSAMLGVGSAMTMETYGISEQTFGVLFAIAASAVMMGPAISRKIIGTRSLRLPLKLGGGLAFFTGLCFATLVLMPPVSLWILWPLVFLYVLSFGIMMPIASAIGLEKAGDAAGTASSLLSTIPTLFAAAGAAVAAMVDGPSGESLFRHGYQSLTIMMAFGGTVAGLVALIFSGDKN